jgi:hypothetical protein
VHGGGAATVAHGEVRGNYGGVQQVWKGIRIVPPHKIGVGIKSAKNLTKRANSAVAHRWTSGGVKMSTSCALHGRFSRTYSRGIRAGEMGRRR